MLRLILSSVPLFQRCTTFWFFHGLINQTLVFIFYEEKKKKKNPDQNNFIRLDFLDQENDCWVSNQTSYAAWSRIFSNHSNFPKFLEFAVFSDLKWFPMSYFVILDSLVCSCDFLFGACTFLKKKKNFKLDIPSMHDERAFYSSHI